MTAVFTALSIVIMYLASVFPTGSLALTAVASLFTIAAVIEAGVGGGAFVYAGTTILGLLLLPDKGVLAFYGLFFGYYPIVKHYAEKLKSRIAEWCVKLAVMNAALSVIIFLFSKAFLQAVSLNVGKLVIYIIFNAAFVVFDIGLSKLIGFYMVRISKNIKQ